MSASAVQQQQCTGKVQGGMKQMKQVHNYSGTETWTPEPQVSFRESLLRVHFALSGLKELGFD